ncbi:hypothetical protein E4P82_06515 [Candidatus Competibacter phosphatis]|uniref:Uncharacterized protein n=1 Tax=Candidatus Competibacter phosphatis TaxID=221280 RepID=A0ABX1THQ0_9GAMM|nr:hypothetical protein [Candidatus Competibacter phosphatis]NMQ18892.1 hypothetical protein [Candidatus Competibacter phosphatis]
MSDRSISQASSTTRYRFGFGLMGPILAECCHALYAYLDAAADGGQSRVLYCARGGLILKRALERYLERIERAPPILGEDFMVSRLAAARLALEVCPVRAAPLLALEFEGRSCAAAASVLSGRAVLSRGDWAQPYRFERLFELMSADAVGRQVHEAMIEQAMLLRAHIALISVGARSLHVVDTGVFGSIGYYLALGLPDKVLHPVLLFRANYKRSAKLVLPPAIGLVCDQDHYCPWKPRSVSRLYWPLIEAFFEPELPSVRTYKRAADGEVLSNLQQPNWRERLSPDSDPVRAGAFDYLATLDPASVPAIVQQSTNAWRALRKRIVYPTQEDIALLGVSRRCVDFGFDDLVSFSEPVSLTASLSRIARVRNSIWPEGKIRKLYPRMAGVWLRLLEANRTITGILRAML